MIGKTISHYKILEKLGEGGMGVVYKAEDTKLGRAVALKFLPGHLEGGDTERARFLQEAKTASLVNHPGVCVIHDIRDHDGRSFIVMEYIDGMTLSEKLRAAPLEIKEVVDYAIQIAEALGAAHSTGVVHRDVKSANIMVTVEGRLKVTDFGLARLKGSQRLTKTSSTIGTLAYMAPEQIQGRESDSRADIFSFGVVLYEMLTRRLPFQAEYEPALIYSILNEEPEPVEKHRDDVPAELSRLLTKALEKDPDHRYQSMAEVAVDLKRLKRDSDKVSRKPPAGVRAAFDNRAADMTASEGPAPVRPATRSPVRKRLFGPGLGLLVAAAVVIAVMEFSGTREPGPREVESRFAQMRIERLTSTGKAKLGAISPDGKYVIHVKEDQDEESLWLRQIATRSDVRVLPAAAGAEFLGLRFSPDGDYVYYVKRDSPEARGALYRMAVLGGASTKILEEVDSPISFSPDGARFAFIRGDWRDGSDALMTAKVDGTEEREIAVGGPEGQFIQYQPSWSPDGETIVSPAKLSDAICALVAVGVTDGELRPLIPRKWVGVWEVDWLSDGSGLVAVVTEESSNYFPQVWMVSHPEGDCRRITNDLNEYNGVSLTRDSRTLLTVQSECLSNIWMSPAEEPARAEQAGASRYAGFFGLSSTPDGRIVHASRDFGIWRMDADGSNERLLISGEHGNGMPCVTPDGRYVVFSSFIGGDCISVHRMDVDGGNLKRLTREHDAFAPRCSPDGKWVIYTSFDPGSVTLRRVSIDGGESAELSGKISIAGDVSPDGRWIACFYKADPAQPQRRSIAVLPFEGGDPIKVFDVPSNAKETGWLGPRWTPDGRSVAYVVDSEGASNIWCRPLDGGTPSQLTDFKDKRIFAFEWSKDGEHILYSRGVINNDVVLIRNFR
jgi:Tol biopolymer transport system component/predicted Ser/Thr protein kinase